MSASGAKYTVKLVVHTERYSDIKKSVYVPENNSIAHTHPCLFLDPTLIAKNGFPAAVSLSPSEAYELWCAGKHVFFDDVEQLDALQQWCPVNYFGQQLYIVKDEARQYEQTLKNKLAELLHDRVGKAAMLVRYFRDKINSPTTTDHEQLQVEEGILNIPGVSEKEFDIYSKFPSLIEKLREEEKLPAIVFMNDRNGVERLTITLNKHVDKKIHDVRANMTQMLAKTQEDSEKVAKKAGKPRKKNRDEDGEMV